MDTTIGILVILKEAPAVMMKNAHIGCWQRGMINFSPSSNRSCTITRREDTRFNSGLRILEHAYVTGRI